MFDPVLQTQIIHDPLVNRMKVGIRMVFGWSALQTIAEICVHAFSKLQRVDRFTFIRWHFTYISISPALVVVSNAIIARWPLPAPAPFVIHCWPRRKGAESSFGSCRFMSCAYQNRNLHKRPVVVRDWVVSWASEPFSGLIDYDFGSCHLGIEDRYLSLYFDLDWE